MKARSKSQARAPAAAQKRDQLKNLALLSWTAWIVFVTLGLGYLHTGKSLSSPMSATFSLFALAGQMGLFVLVTALLPAIAATLGWGTLQKVLSGLLFGLLGAFLAIDVKLYELFRFHFNAFALNVVLTPGGFATMGIQTVDLVLALSALGLLIALLFFMQLWTERRLVPRLQTHRVPIGRWFLAAVLFCGVSERAIYAWADYTDEQDVTRNTDVLPFYEPFLIRGNLVALLGDPRAPGQTVSPSIDAFRPPSESRLNYPDSTLTAHVKQPLNVLFIVVESARGDMLTPEVMPQLSTFAESAQVFLGHHSGGNSTRFGLFSLIYGMDGLYWQNFLSERRSPALFSLLRNAGYERIHFTGAKMDYPEFRQTVFAEDREVLFDEYPGLEPWQRDDKLVDGFNAFLKNRQTQAAKVASVQAPFYSVVFLDGPHGPYSFPPSAEIFSAGSQSVSSYFEILDREKATGALARYKNALHYADRNIGRILGTLRETGELNRTLIFVTGDHGQEFWEYGFYGHNGAFNPAQAMVPGVLFVPGIPPARHSHWTEHQDVVPTLMKHLGVELQSEVISTGRDLFDSQNREHTIVCSFSECALRDPQGWIVFGTQSKKSLKLDYFDAQYRPVDRAQGATPERLQRLTRFFSERPFLSSPNGAP